ncbi:hypothetical protein J6590_005609 [Homalodisca vitripennis]|nr:hypothetical protein J6590_005609 [Homalodisca vitripennis]
MSESEAFHCGGNQVEGGLAAGDTVELRMRGRGRFIHSYLGRSISLAQQTGPVLWRAILLAGPYHK